MAEGSSNGSPARSGFFSGLKFWLSRQVPMRQHYMDSMKTRGATIVALESQADMCIVDDARKNLPAGKGYYSYKYIAESMKKNRLVDPADYVIGLRSAADRQVGSVTIAAKGRRTPFSKQDDQILYNWLEPYRRKGGKWKGNDIYKQLEREHPHHTYQSWRSRYLSMVDHGTKMTVTEPLGPSAQSDDEGTAGLHNRSPKRRRVNRSQFVSVHDVPRTSPARLAPARMTAIASPRACPRARQSPGSSVPILPREQNTESAGENGEENAVVPKQPTTTKPSDLEKRSGTRGSVELPDSRNHTRPDEDSSKEQQSSIRRTNVSFAEQVSHALASDAGSDSSTGELGGYDTQTEPPNHDHSIVTDPNLPLFSLEDIQGLYRAVPHVYNTRPRDLEKSWENLVADRGRHTPAEWRILYETAILPEYMRRNNLNTSQDLHNHVEKVLEEEQISRTQQHKVKKEPVSRGNSPAAEQPNNQSEPASQTQPVQEEDTEMFFRNEPQSPLRTGQDNTAKDDSDSAFLRRSSPVLEPQIILRVIEVKEDGKVVAQDSSVVRSVQMSPPGTQGSISSARRKLFGRTLDQGVIDSQLQEAQVATGSAPPQELSLGTISVASALAPVNSQSVSSLERPPESGQRPPKSLTMSQEDSAASDIVDQGQTVAVEILDVLAASDKIAGDAEGAPTVLRAASPTLDLLGEGVVGNDQLPSSPGLSDTGSEYMAFDTAPERSQLWDPSQDELDDEVEDDQHEEESENESFEIIQHPAGSTPRRQTPKILKSTNVFRPPQNLSQSGKEDSDEHQNEVEDQIERESSPEQGVQVTTGTKPLSRIETQALFQQPVPQVEEDTTIFDLPPPEGGWEQFGEMEEDIEDIRTSVELVDHGLLEDRVLSSSTETTEVGAESVDEAEGSLEIPPAKEVFVISENGSSHTTFSEDEESPTPKEIPGVYRKVPRAHMSSSGTERTASSHAGYSPKTDLEGGDTDGSSTSSEEQSAIESWFSNQPRLHDSINSRIVNRLASTALQATILNLSSATFTLRDMVASFERSEVNRRAQFKRDARIKREYTPSTPQPRFKPKTMLTETEARQFLPRDMLGVWTIEDDKDFLSRTSDGLERVEQKHGATGVRKRAKFLKLRYGQETLVGVETPKTLLASARRQI